MSQRINTFKYPDGHRKADNPYINTKTNLKSLIGLRKTVETDREINSKDNEVNEVASIASKAGSGVNSLLRSPFSYQNLTPLETKERKFGNPVESMRSSGRIDPSTLLKPMQKYSQEYMLTKIIRKDEEKLKE